jgi:hypothetical protein
MAKNQIRRRAEIGADISGTMAAASVFKFRE